MTPKRRLSPYGCYNGTKIDKTPGVTPQIAAALADRVFDVAEVVALIEAGRRSADARV
jgi:hypothetical protein